MVLMKALLTILFLTMSVGASEKAVTGPNQGMTAYTAGVYGTPIFDMSNDTDWSLTARIRWDPLAGFASSHDIFAQASFSGSFTCAGVILRTNSTDNLSVRVAINGGTAQNIVMTGSTPITSGTFYSMVVTHTSGHVWTQYLNGASDATATSSQTIGTNCNISIATIGGATDCGGSEIGCWINDVAMFQGVLTAGDIAAFSSGTRPNQLSINPAAWWPMDGGFPGPCAPLAGGYPDLDESGHGHTLKLGNDPAPDYCGTGTRTNFFVGPDNGEATH